MSFDGNGRMYVVEMRSYMQDVDGTNSRAPISRISRHEDTNGDGIYDKHTVFVDKLVMPRIAFPLDDGVMLVLETDNRDSTSTRTRTATASPTRRSCSTRALAASPTWSGSRAV